MQAHQTRLDRLISVEPKWWYYHARGLTHSALQEWDAAARDFHAATQGAGDWYMRAVPRVFDEETMGRLIMADEPRQIIVDELHVAPERAEVFLRMLAIRRLFKDDLRRAALPALMDGNATHKVHEKALQIVESFASEEKADPPDTFMWGLALYRTGSFEEALTVLTRAEKALPITYNYNRDMLDSDILAAQALSNAGLGKVAEARGSLSKARAMVQGEDDARRPLLVEAEELISDLEFPRNPFAP